MIPGRGRGISFQCCVQIRSEAHSAFYLMDTEGSTEEMKQSKDNDDRSPIPSVKVKNV
jgi:hypothetical protein